MNIYLGPGTYAGDPWAPDEVAKALVQDMKLRDGDTVTKSKIIEYLAKYGLGPLWATDVAMVLRNMFGVTPTFFEDKLVNELRSLVEHNEDEVQGLTEGDVKFAYEKSLQDEFNATESLEDEIILAFLASESLETVCQLANLGDQLTNEELSQVESCYIFGGERLLEAWYDYMYRPHMVRFFDESLFADLGKAIGLTEGPATVEKSIRRKAIDREMKARAAVAATRPGDLEKGIERQKRSMTKEDPLAARAKSAEAGINLLGRHQMNKSAAGLSAIKGSTPSARVPNVKQGGENSYIAKQRSAAMRGMEKAKQSPMSLPADVPSPGGDADIRHPLVKAADKAASGVGGAAKRMYNKAKFAAQDMQPGKAVVSKFANLAGRARDAAGGVLDKLKQRHQAGLSASQAMSEPEQGQEPKQSFGDRLMAKAKSVAGRVGSSLANAGSRFAHAHRAKMRVSHPHLTYLLHGEPGDKEKEAAAALGLHKEYAKMGHALPGHEMYGREIASPYRPYKSTAVRRKIRQPHPELG